MTPFARVGIAGVGLIGGSFALAARRAGIAREIVGFGRTRRNLDVALERRIVDRADVVPEVLRGCDFVLLATPVASLAASAAAIAPHLAPDAIVTDAGSVKKEVVATCTAALAGHGRFVGSHPIAGTEDSGAAAAELDLLSGARCVVTPAATTDPMALARVAAAWEAVGMEVVEMSPAAHDAALAITSHAPHLLAFALALAAGEAEDLGIAAGADALGALIGPSFRDVTRVAASSPETWRDILLGNRDAVGAAAQQVRARLDLLLDALRSGDAVRVEDLIARARLARRTLVPSGGAGEAVATAITPARAPLSGRIRVAGDKSIAHRAVLFGALANGVTTVRGVGHGRDNAATVRVLRSLGVRIEREGPVVRVHGSGFTGLRAPAADLDCANSGTTMRLLAGVLAGRPFESRLDGDASLRRRPMERVIAPLRTMGAAIESSDGHAPLTVRGRALRGAEATLGVASAQVKTAVLLAGLQAEGATLVREPGPSRDHTERLLPCFGAVVERVDERSVRVAGGQTLCACEVDVPGDPSAAAFWLVAGAIVPGSRLTIERVTVNPTRTGALDVLRAMGADLRETACKPMAGEPVADLEIRHGRLRATEVAGDLMVRAIDEFPILAVAAAVAEGETHFRDGAELRVKESDRIAAMAAGLRRLGVDVEVEEDGMRVRGGAAIRAGEVDSFGDHRIAMAFAVLALVAEGPVTIRGAAAIGVSDPAFLRTLQTLRGVGA